MKTFEEFLQVSGRKLSDEQMAVVKSDVATVVSAGAGSGKTTVLSYRFLRLVMEGKAGVDEILTLTFTKKAASEMYDRIFSLLNSVSADNDVVREEMRNFASSYISTLDSFSNEIARTDCARYGVSRDFEILDEDAENKLFSFVVSSLFEQHSDVMLPISKVFNPDSIASDLFLPLSEEITILSDWNADYEKNIYLSFLSRIEKYFVNYALSVLNEIESYRTSAMDDSIFFKDGPESIQRIREYLSTADYERLPKFNLNLVRAKIYSEIKAVINEKWRPILPLLQSLKENFSSNFSYFEVFSIFCATLNSEKRRRGVLNFNDTSALALDILKENGAVRDYYKKKFRFIMIDEFQDNSAAQRDLLYILSEREDICGVGVPSKNDLDKTKLFFVGDDKQSIYAFRKADVSVFNNLKDEIISIGGKFLSMRANYRSEPNLIDHFNRIFPSIMQPAQLDDVSICSESFFENEAGRNLSSYEASFESVFSRPASPDVKGSVTYARSEEMEDDGNVSDTLESEEEKLNEAENEAEFIVELVKRIISDPSYMVPDGTISRPATYDDIAILYRTSKSQMPLEKVFRREEIPYTVVSSNSITLEALAFDIVAFISLLLFPMDKRSYMAALRSPFVRLGDESLMAIKDSFSDYELKGEPFTHILPSFSPEEKQKMEEVRAFYLDLKKDVGRLSAEQILDRLYYESGYSSYIESIMSLSSYIEDYEYLWEFARRKVNVFYFLSYLKERMDSPDKMDVELLRLNMRGIRLMNIHKSKGLEFPIVILAGTNSRPRVSDSSILIHSSFPEFISLDLSEQKGIRKLFSDFTRRRLDAEAKRLLYVALTRAETHLIVIASGKKIRSRSLASLYDGPASEDKNVKRMAFKTLSENEIERKWEKANTFPEYYDKECLVRGAYKEERGAVKQLSHYNDESYSLSEDFQHLKEFENGVDSILEKHNLYSDFGTLLHQTLDSYFKKISTPYYKNAILSERDEKLLNAEAYRILEDFLSSPFYERYIAGREVLSEERFYMPYEDIVAEGAMDLIVFENDYNLIIDYKSDREMNPDYHKGQLISYMKAAESIYEKKCYGVLLYLRSMDNGPFWDASGSVVKVL